MQTKSMLFSFNGEILSPHMISRNLLHAYPQRSTDASQLLPPVQQSWKNKGLKFKPNQ